eukprot:1906461-Rhodomonas_salina.1
MSPQKSNRPLSSLALTGNMPCFDDTSSHVRAGLSLSGSGGCADRCGTDPTIRMPGPVLHLRLEDRIESSRLGPHQTRA